MRTITINPVLNGFIVNVGCQTLAYTSREKLVLDIGDYLKNPQETEKRILEKEAMNIEHTMRNPIPREVAPDECATQCEAPQPMTSGGVMPNRLR